MSLNPSSGSSPRAESDSFLSTSPLANSRLKGIMLSILTSHSDSVHSIIFRVSFLSRTSHNLADGEQWCEWIKNSGICWLDRIHSSPVLRTKWSETQVYIRFFPFAVSTEESSFFAVIYISSRWLNVRHPHGVSARRHDGCLPALFLPVIECYGPEEVSAAFNICSLSLCHCIIPAPVASSSWTHPLASGRGSFFRFFKARWRGAFPRRRELSADRKKRCRECLFSLAPSAQRSRSFLGNYTVTLYVESSIMVL